MAEILLFHHALGRTPGFLGFADVLRAAGHVVHTPDSYRGRTFSDLDEGLAFAQSLGHVEVFRRAAAAGGRTPPGPGLRGVLLGLRAGAVSGPDQTRGAGGAAVPRRHPHPGVLRVLARRCGPAGAHDGQDPWVDLDVCHTLASQVPGAALFIHPGSAHLFADPGTPDHDPPDHDPPAARLLMERTLAFLAS